MPAPSQHTPDTSLSAEDFDAIEGAVMETVRGRWFLLEYARRNRAIELAQIRDALHRMEQAMSAKVAQPLQEFAPAPMRAVAKVAHPLAAFDALPVSQKLALFG